MNKCCNCKNLVSYVEPIGPGQGMIIHVCSCNKQKVKYNDNCNINKFEKK